MLIPSHIRHWGNIARTRMKSGVEQKQGRLVLVGHSYLQHIPGNHGRPADLACSKTSEASSERWVPRIRPRDEERVANELKLKLSIQVSRAPSASTPAMTARRAHRTRNSSGGTSSLITPRSTVACTFFVVTTGAFRALYVFVERDMI